VDRVEMRQNPNTGTAMLAGRSTNDGIAEAFLSRSSFDLRTEVGHFFFIPKKKKFFFLTAVENPFIMKKIFHIY
jgi:hypothetical protein